MELLKSQLWTSWAPKSIEIFSRIPPVFINGDADAYFRSIATLQSNQLRELVTRSMDSYVAFFSRHVPVDDIDPQQDRLLWSVPPVFELELVEDNGEEWYCSGVHPRCTFFAMWQAQCYTRRRTASC